MATQPYFKNIRKQILEALDKATNQISVAVCWFTNENLFDVLCQKLTEGLRVELIILDDYINSNPLGCDFSKFLELNGILYLSDVERPMHNKYCIIDNKTIINGSYNWTYFAEERNEENIIIFDDCESLITEFNADFSRLKELCRKVEVYKRKPLLEFENAKNENKAWNTFSVFNMLSNDLFLKSIETNNKVFYQAAKRITPDNVYFQRKAVELNWEKQIILNATLSEGLIYDQVHVIFPKDTLIPAESHGSFTTTRDNQTKMNITILRGENVNASRNVKVVRYEIENIPSLKAGEASIPTEYKISTNGKLFITKYIHDTGLVDKRTIDLNTFKLLKNQ